MIQTPQISASPGRGLRNRASLFQESPRGTNGQPLYHRPARSNPEVSREKSDLACKPRRLPKDLTAGECQLSTLLAFHKERPELAFSGCAKNSKTDIGASAVDMN